MSNLKNMQSFEKLIGICTGLGGSYKPGNGNLQVEALNTLLYNAQQILHEVSRAHAAYDYSTNKREALFKAAGMLATRACKVLVAGGASQSKIDTARAILRKMRGTRKYKAAEEVPVTNTTGQPTEAAKSPSVYGRNFANFAYQFTQLVEVLTNEPTYKANEPDLTAEALNQTAAGLHAANAEVIQAEVTLAKARRVRNEMLYKQYNSMVSTARAVTAYVCGAFGYLSPQHMELVRLNFSKPNF